METGDYIAVSVESYNLYGCPYCGCLAPVHGYGTVAFNCGECGNTSFLLAKGIRKSNIGVGSPPQYPEIKKHPREGIPPHYGRKKTSKIKLFFECFFKWRPEPETDGREIDAIFCQAFGLRSDGPGKSNNYMAACILETYYQDPKPLIIQGDCADALPDDIKIDLKISKHQEPGKYLDTWEVTRQCAEYCRVHNISTVLFFAHPAHAWRVQKTIEKFRLRGVPGNTIGTPYDPKSVQIWTRSKWLFIPREILSRLLYLFTNKI